MTRGIYNTKQKDLILDYIKKNNKDFNSQDIYIALNKKVGLTTIYRLLDTLIKDNKLEKVTSNKSVKYRYLEECSEENHFYLKCNKCGKIYHIDCDCLNNLYNDIYHEHKFKIDHRNIVLNGICKNCNN